MVKLNKLVHQVMFMIHQHHFELLISLVRQIFFEGIYKDKGSVEFDGVVSGTDVVSGFEPNEKCLIMIRQKILTY